MGIICPEAELEECLVYECARRTTFWPAVFETVRKIGDPKDFVPSENGWARVFEFLCLFPEFPNEPWLFISPKERTARLNKYLKREPRRIFPPGTPGLAPDRRRDLPVQPFESLSQSGDLLPTDAMWETTARWNDGSDILNRYCLGDLYNPDADRRIRIDWFKADHEIVTSFEAWLKAERPAKYAIYGGRGKKPKGENVLRSALKGLGALNLSDIKKKIPSFSRKVAIKATKYMEKGYKRKLFESATAMRRAEKAVLQRIEAITPDILELRHHSQDPYWRPSLGRIVRQVPNPGKTTVRNVKNRWLCFLRDVVYEYE